MRLYKCNYLSGVVGTWYKCNVRAMCGFLTKLGCRLCRNCSSWCIAHEVQTLSVTHYLFVCASSSSDRLVFTVSPYKGVATKFYFCTWVLRFVTWRLGGAGALTIVTEQVGQLALASQGQRTVSVPLMLKLLYVTQKIVFSFVTQGVLAWELFTLQHRLSFSLCTCFLVLFNYLVLI